MIYLHYMTKYVWASSFCIPGNIKNMYCKEIDTGFYMCYTTKH